MYFIRITRGVLQFSLPCYHVALITMVKKSFFYSVLILKQNRFLNQLYVTLAPFIKATRCVNVGIQFLNYLIWKFHNQIIIHFSCLNKPNFLLSNNFEEDKYCTLLFSLQSYVSRMKKANLSFLQSSGLSNNLLIKVN